MLDRSRTYLLDGAMGTELARRGARTDRPLWSARALIEQPALVLTIHNEYVEAGAEILTTNTFRTTPRAFRNAGVADRSAELTDLAVTLAGEARAKAAHEVMIAGSLAPLEDCYRPDLVPSGQELADEHGLHAERLARNGADILLCETLGTIREAKAACKAALDTGRPVVVSFLCRADSRLYGGEPLEEAVRQIASLCPFGIAVNCMPARAIRGALDVLRSATALPLGAYGNVGMEGKEQAESMTHAVSAEEYASLATTWLEGDMLFVGGCCGTTPEYIRRLRMILPRNRSGR